MLRAARDRRDQPPRQIRWKLEFVQLDNASVCFIVIYFLGKTKISIIC